MYYIDLIRWFLRLSYCLVWVRFNIATSVFTKFWILFCSSEVKVCCKVDKDNMRVKFLKSEKWTSCISLNCFKKKLGSMHFHQIISGSGTLRLTFFGYVLDHCMQRSLVVIVVMYIRDGKMCSRLKPVHDVILPSHYGYQSLCRTESDFLGKCYGDFLIYIMSLLVLWL